MLRPFVLSLALTVAAAAPVALAREPAAGAEPAGVPVEHLLSMAVEGRVVIETDGQVHDYSLDTKMAPELAEMLGKAIRGWRFEPVVIDGQPSRAETHMRVSLAAKESGKDYEIRLDNVVFLDSREAVKDERVGNIKPAAISATARKMNPPLYPTGLMRARIGARVLVALHFSPEGDMIDVVPVQTMIFDARGPDAIMAQAMAQFEASTVEAAKKWLVNVKQQPGVPTTAKDFTAYTTVEYEPVDPGFGKRQHPRPTKEPVGKWRTVARSAKRALPWLSGLHAPEIGVADVANGEWVPIAGAPQLKTPVAGTAL